MCSNYEDGELTLVNERQNQDLKHCMKCKHKAAQVIIRVHDPFCKECFLHYATHKFRSAFGKSKIIREGDEVVVAFSGGAASTAMLHFIQEGRSVHAQKKLRFTPTYVYIDECTVLGIKDEDRLIFNSRIENVLKNSGYNYHILRLETIYESYDELSARDKLRLLFESINTITAKEQLLSLLRHNLLIQTCKKLGFTKVLAGDTASRLAVVLLSNIAQGKGAHLTFDTGFTDDRSEDVLVIRPMRDFTNKEIAIYNFFHGLQPVTMPNLSTMEPVSASLNRLTENFVTDLQEGFPATINTILRTGDKLMSSHHHDSPENVSNCTFCKAPLDTNVPLLSAMESLKYSEELITIRKSQCHESDPQKVSPVDWWGLLPEHLCYGCQRMVKDMNGTSNLDLPHILTSTSNRRQQQESSIQEFLIS